MFRKYAVFCLTLVALLSVSAEAAVKRYFEDAKFPAQQMVEKQTITNPAAAGSVDVLNANAGNTSAAAVTVSSFVSQPDVPRNLVISVGGTTNDVAGGTIVISGTDFLGASLSENYVAADNQSAAITGSKAFKTVTSVLFPANLEEGTFAATWSIGYGEKIGLKRCMDNAGHVFHSSLNGAKEATAPTLAADDDEVSKNTADFNGTMNGSNDFEIFFMQNYRCL